MKTDVKAIAIGGSAGAVVALMQLLPALPADLHVPVFVVVHLPPWQPSLLPELFSSKSALPVCEAEDKQPVRPGRVYTAPPDYHLLLERVHDVGEGEGPTLALSADEPLHFSRPAIDVLFETAADCYGAGLLAVVLTGASGDGAQGLAHVLRQGGTGWIQDPETSPVPMMPLMAARQCPDATVLSLEAMAERLAAAAF